MTRHYVFVVPPVLIGRVDLDEKLDNPAVSVEFPCQLMLDHSTPSFREFLLDCLTPSNNRHQVRVVVSLKERETLAIVEFSVEMDGFNAEFKTVENAEKLSEDTAGGVAIDETGTASVYRLFLTRAYSVV